VNSFTHKKIRILVDIHIGSPTLRVYGVSLRKCVSTDDFLIVYCFSIGPFHDMADLSELLPSRDGRGRGFFVRARRTFESI
jgi:hypothetical protein